MENKIKKLLSRLNEVEERLGEPHVAADQAAFRDLTREHFYLNSVKQTYEALCTARKDLADNQEMLSVESDAEFCTILKDEIKALEEKIPHLEGKLQTLLVPPDPKDHLNTIIELRAGTGGDEAALFVGDCVRMYKLYAEAMGWKYEELSASEADLGGYKDYVMVVSGENVYRFLKHEAGTHRVQRVPETETQGRVHTSAITVAVLVEPDDNKAIKIDEKELRIDTYRSSGAGGQHVNTTDSAVRITHLPTGIVVTCQQERSQHKNKEKALRFLKAKLAEAEEAKRNQEMASTRNAQVGTGDRSGRIRTYNFSQNRVTDHRINMTSYNLDRVMQGDLSAFSEALVADLYKQQLTS